MLAGLNGKNCFPHHTKLGGMCFLNAAAGLLCVFDDLPFRKQISPGRKDLIHEKGPCG